MQLQAADPHDAIAAQLRDLTPRRTSDAPELDDTPAASPEPASEPLLRAAPLNDNTGDIRIPAPRRRSGPAAVMLAVCAGVAATVAWHAYGDEAKQRLSHVVPQLFAYVPAIQSIGTTEPKDTASQVAASQAAAAQSVTDPASAPAGNNPPATPTPSTSAPAPALPATDTPPAQAAPPPELMQSIETMTREIDSLKQAVQQLQAGQQQMSRDIAKLSEHETRHKVVEQTPKPASRSRSRRASMPVAASQALARHLPPRAVSSQGQTYPQGAVQHDAYIPPPPPPARLPPLPGDSSVPRPPMPLQ